MTNLNFIYLFFLILRNIMSYNNARGHEAVEISSDTGKDYLLRSYSTSFDEKRNYVFHIMTLMI